jgi:cell fate regulator YaaT (PSP1 superfamily)
VNIVEEQVKLVGVAFRKDARMYFLPKPPFALKLFQKVMVETPSGLKMATVRRPLIKMDVKRWDSIRSRGLIGHIIRVANEKDLTYIRRLEERESEAFKICREKITKHGLPMHLIATEWDENDKKYVFYFTSDSRVDFRELVKDLTKTLNHKIQLWQVGARDAMRFFGDYGPCGRPLCCNTWMMKKESVELSFAKMQGVPLNTAKITGVCGKLVCCLRFELDMDKVKK